MDAGLSLRRVEEELPDIKYTTCRRVTHGWDHAVLILDESLVFRTPKNPADPHGVVNEARLVRYLKSGEVSEAVSRFRETA